GDDAERAARLPGPVPVATRRDAGCHGGGADRPREAPRCPPGGRDCARARLPGGAPGARLLPTGRAGPAQAARADVPLAERAIAPASDMSRSDMLTTVR